MARRGDRFSIALQKSGVPFTIAIYLIPIRVVSEVKKENSCKGSFDACRAIGDGIQTLHRSIIPVVLITAEEKVHSGIRFFVYARSQ
jgi:hypothetical protein